MIKIFAFVLIGGSLISAEKEITPDLKFHYDKMQKVVDKLNIVSDDTSITKFNETHFRISTNVTLREDVKNSTMIKFILNRADTEDGEYVIFFETNEYYFCVFQQTIYKNLFWPTLKDNNGIFPNPDECPLKAGQYYVIDYYFNISLFAKFLTPGFYRFTLIASDADKSAKVQYDIYGHCTEMN